MQKLSVIIIFGVALISRAIAAEVAENTEADTNVVAEANAVAAMNMAANAQAGANSLFLTSPSTNSACKKFHIGATGINITIEKGMEVTFLDTEGDSPAAGKFNKGDILTAVNGRSLTGAVNPYVVLGEELTAAEAKDGTLTFTKHAGVIAAVPVMGEVIDNVEIAINAITDEKEKARNTLKNEKVIVTIPVLGAYSKTWPLNCKKSDAIVRQAAAFYTQRQNLKYEGFFGGLFLLSTGDDQYLPIVKAMVNRYSPVRAGDHTWGNGYAGILLGEYYLRTGDESALPRLKAICVNSENRLYTTGGWNHWGGCGTGYVQGGLMNPAGIQLLSTFILAQECGIAVDPVKFNRALKFFYRFAGHGTVAYGDQRCEGWLSGNGKSGMLAGALSLLDGKSYQMAAQSMALDMADSYRWLGCGHANAFGDHVWRGLGAVHVSEARQANYRRCMDKLAWYYDLCRFSKGGFGLLNMGAGVGDGCNDGHAFGKGVVMAYTAPRKTLRITGGPHTKFSKKVIAPDQPWGNKRDEKFLLTDNCEGFGKEELEPHAIFDKLGDSYSQAKDAASKEFCVKMMRHNSIVIRTQAGQNLGKLGAVDEIVAALKDPDPRVKRAGLDAISMYTSWWGGGPGSLKPEVVSEKCFEPIVKILNDPDSAWYEIDGALNALGFAKVNDVASQFGVIKKFLKHEEWWLREASWRALRPVMKNEALLKEILPDLLKCLEKEIHTMPRRVFMSELKNVLVNKKMSVEIKKQITEGMLLSMQNIDIEPGYNQAIGATSIQETPRFLNLQGNPKLALNVYEVLKGKSLDWGYSGGWGDPGMLACAETLYKEKEAGPMIAGIKKLLPELEAKLEKLSVSDGKMDKKGQSMLDNLSFAVLRMRKVVENYEKIYGILKP